MRSSSWLVLVLLIVVGACSNGPDAPALGASEVICGDNFCMNVPEGWEIIEQTGEFVSVRHSSAPDDTVGTVGQVNMEGLVNAAGLDWPQSTIDVVESFWSIIDGGGAEMATMSPLRDGSVESFGSFEGGRLWYRLLPTEGRAAVGVEVRAPNSTWSEHAEAILDSLTVLP